MGMNVGRIPVHQFLYNSMAMMLSTYYVDEEKYFDLEITFVLWPTYTQFWYLTS